MGNVCSCSFSIDQVVIRCWDCLARQGKYVCELEENLNALRTEWEELKSIRNDIKRKIDIAEEGQQMKRLDQLEWWLSEVEGMEAKVDELITDGPQEIEKKCLGGCCPKNCKASYEMGKKVAKKLQEVTALKNKGGAFEVVAEKLPLALVEEMPSEPTVGLESTFDDVWSYIRDEQVGIIGLCGMGGVGKTTLLTKINNKLCNTTHGFDVVIWVVVSKNSNPEKVQDDIGKIIGFQIQDDTWKNKSQDEKARDIFRVLKKKKFVLFLDDIWKQFDLLEVGVPLPNEGNKSKVVFTTRFGDVCGSMDAQKIIEVKCLSWENSWELFQKKVGEDTINFHPEITKLAKFVTRECDGLPLALKTIGRAMARKKRLEEWNYALQVLQKSATKFSSMEEKVFFRLKFSYDNLQSATARSCFLYCSLFPEDYLIFKETLIEYWIGEGFLDRNVDLNGAKNEGHYVIGTLIQACLLEEDSIDIVKMHDVIRDMALWIALEFGNVVKDKVLVEAGAGLEKAPDVGKWEGVGRMSLMGNHIEELTETPSCPNLSTLFLNQNKLRMITHGFFQNMPNLRILDLSRNYNLVELPVEIFDLVSLQYLNLSWTKIRELPIEFKNLRELKYLDLDCTTRLNIIPEGVLSSFKKLQVLKMYQCGSVKLLEEDSVLSTLVEELECLKDLNHLRITIKTVDALSHFLSSPKLPSCTKRLSLQRLFRGSKYLDISFLENMRCLDELQINTCWDLEDLKVERAGEGMPYSEITAHPSFDSLFSVHIWRCPKLKELTWLIFAPNLEDLRIQGCSGMEEVISGLYPNLFAKLRNIHLLSLPQLKSIYPNALPFPCLKYISVWKCPNLKKLPLKPDSAKGCGAVIEGHEEWWNALEWEDEATRNAFLPSFKSILK